jgi:hypothetical protein
MNTQLNTMYISTLAAFAIGGCLGPNPWLKKECGQSWSVVAQGATGEKDPGQVFLIQNDGQWISASACYNDAQSENALDPESTEYMALRNAALTACQNQAIEMGLVSENCEETLTEPVNGGTCMLNEAECSAPGETGETGGTGETGETSPTDVGFDTPANFVRCVMDKCTVQQALIDQVLQANADTFAVDGTILAPHTSTTGVQDGWEFDGITKGNLGYALGFVNGDVVTEVGGEPFDNWNALLDAANAALHADTVEVVFIRDNRVLTRRYSRI